MNCFNCHHPEELHDPRYGCTKADANGRFCRCLATFTHARNCRILQQLAVALVLSLVLTFGAMAQSAEQIANQRLSKAMDVIDTQDRYIAALEARGKAQDERDKAKDDLILIITKQRDDALAIKCNKTSYFFGIVKKTRCY